MQFHDSNRLNTFVIYLPWDPHIKYGGRNIDYYAVKSNAHFMSCNITKLNDDDDVYTHP